MTTDNKHSLELFKIYLKRKGLRDTSIKTSVGHLNLFLSRYPLANAEEFIMDLSEKKKSSYINCIISSLKNYGQFIKDTRLQEIPYFKVQESEKAILSDEEIEAFLSLEAPQTLNKSGKKSYAKMTMFWHIIAFSGARCGEISTLDINHVDFGRNLLLVDGKTGRRNVPISPILLVPLQSYIRNLDNHLLFPSRITTQCINKATWHLDFQNRIKRLGIVRDRLSPHSLRHSFITRMLDEDVNLFKVQKLVGHRSISSTARYTHLTTKDLQRTIIQDRLGRKNIPPREVINQFKTAIMNHFGDDDRFRYEITDKGIELMFKIELLGEK